MASEFQQKTAIVTGATGGIGRNLTDKLLAQGWRVITCGRDVSIGSQLNTPFKAFDLADKSQTIANFCPADAVFHCAALSSPWGQYDAFYEANVSATLNVIDAVRHYGIAKLIHVSTPSIYFSYADMRDITEDHLPKQFVNHYAKTKYLAEQAVTSASDIHRVIIRPRGIFGAYDTAVVPRLLKVADKGFLPLIKRTGRQAGDALLDITHVDNVVDALILAYESDANEAEAFNISNGEPYTLKQIYQLLMDALAINASLKTIPYPILANLARLLEQQAHWQYKLFKVDKEPLMTAYSVGAITYDQTLDLHRARTRLGYEPRVSIKEGLLSSVAYYQGLTYAD